MTEDKFISVGRGFGGIDDACQAIFGCNAPKNYGHGDRPSSYFFLKDLENSKILEGCSDKCIAGFMYRYTEDKNAGKRWDNMFSENIFSKDKPNAEIRVLCKDSKEVPVKEEREKDSKLILFVEDEGEYNKDKYKFAGIFQLAEVFRIYGSEEAIFSYKRILSSMRIMKQ